MPVGERRLLETSDLTPVEQQLCGEAAEGRLLDLRSGRAADDAPTSGRSWGSERQLRAQVLVQLLTGQGPQLTATAGAVRVRGAAVAGDLALGGLTLRCPLELNDCYMSDRLDLVKAEALDISLHGSYLQQGLSACQLQLKHDLNLAGGFVCLGETSLAAAHIKGNLDCSGSTFINPNGEALAADGLTVDGAMLLCNATVFGELQLVGAPPGRDPGSGRGDPQQRKQAGADR